MKILFRLCPKEETRDHEATKDGWGEVITTKSKRWVLHLCYKRPNRSLKDLPLIYEKHVHCYVISSCRCS
jgi:hypothetical protein